MRKPYVKGDITLDELLQCAIRTKSGCMEWQYSCDRNGYGQLRRQGKLLIVTRLVMHLKYGFNLKSPLFVLHKCDNPKCIKPSHLFTGSHKENMNDKVKKKRQQCGEKMWNAKFKVEQIKTMRAMYEQGLSIKAIAALYDHDYGATHRILKNKTWKHIQDN